MVRHEFFTSHQTPDEIFEERSLIIVRFQLRQLSLPVLPFFAGRESVECCQIERVYDFHRSFAGGMHLVQTTAFRGDAGVQQGSVEEMQLLRKPTDRTGCILTGFLAATPTKDVERR